MKNILIIFTIIFCINTFASDSFEANLLLKETSKEGTIISTLKEKINFSNNKIDKNIKYNNILKKLIQKVIIFENKYEDEALFFVESIEDENKKAWTISTNVMSSDTSVSQFIVVYDDKIISGWINRNNKDFFGMRIFNF